MPKKKQTPRNAFFYFMQDFKTQQGRGNMNMRDVADAASPHWNRMTKEQKRPYEEMALREKNNIRGGKFTSEGLDVEQLENEERQEQMKIQDMQHDIKSMWNMARSSGRIQDELIFIIHVNTFCYCTSEDRHYPAEIAITCFSLEDGVLPQNVFHRIIQPGFLPLGYASDANHHSRETHQLPPPKAGEHDNNMEDVYNEMKDFLSTKLSGSKRMPILHTDKKLMKMVQHVLDTWCYDYGEPNPLFKVFDLQYMFRVLRNTISGDEVWHSDTFGTREIEKDVYAYTNGIACEFHDVTSVPVFCSRSVCIRYAYIICDNCCPELRITLIPGTHLPDKAMKTNYKGSSRASSASSVSSRSSRFTDTSVRDDDSDSVLSFSSKSDWDNQSLISETSSSTTIDCEDNFPSLGARKKMTSAPTSWNQFSPNDCSSGQSYESSGKSYARIMGTSGLSRRPMDIPSSFSNNSGSFDSSNSVDMSMGRGRGRRNDDANDFPALGRGRGLALGRSKKTNNTD